MKALLIGLVFLSSFVFAKDLEVFTGGQYTCDFDRKPQFVKTKGPFALVIAQDGARSSTRNLKLVNKKYSLEATNYDGLYFQKITSDFPTLNNMPVFGVSTFGEDNDATEINVGIVFETEPYTTQADSLKCVGQPIMKKVPIIQLECDTLDQVGDKQIPVKLRFALANLADPEQVHVLTYEGDASADFTPIQVTPGSSYFTSLNDNLIAFVRRDYVIIEGDSDGVYYSHLRLNRPDLTQGVAWLEGDDEVSETRRAVSCVVTGDIENAFDDRTR